MKRLMCVLVAGIAAVAGAADLSYTPQGEGPYYWNNAAAWGGTLPTDADNTLLCTPGLSLKVGDGTEAEAYDLNLSNSVSTLTDVPVTLTLGTDAKLSLKNSLMLGAKGSKSPFVLRQEAGSVLSGVQFMSAWTSGTTNYWELAEGAQAAFDKFYLGRVTDSVTVVTNRGNIVANTYFHLGKMNGSHAYFEDYGTTTVYKNFSLADSWGTVAKCNPYACYHLHQGAALKVKPSGDSAAAFYVGSDGTGELQVEGVVEISGTARLQTAVGDPKNTAVGHSVGRIVVSGDGIITNTNLKVTLAYGTCGESSVVLQDQARFYVNPPSKNGAVVFGNGTNAVSSLSILDDAQFIALKNAGMEFAVGPGSTSTVVVAGSDKALIRTPSGTGMQTGVGENSVVSFTIGESAKLESRSDFGLAVGKSSRGSVCVTNQANFLVYDNLWIAKGQDSCAEVRLSDGVYGMNQGKDPAAATDYKGVYVGSSMSSGRLTGWGQINLPNYTLSARRPMSIWLQGQIVADGGMLDLLRCTDINSDFGSDDWTGRGENTTGTNGWYAINKGRLVFPHYLAVSNRTWCVGDKNMLAKPLMANAFAVNFDAETPIGNDLFASLYATDHDDVPAGLPSDEKGDHVIAVWRASYADAAVATDPGKSVAFGSADLTFRYSTAGMNRCRNYDVRLWRYDATVGEWVCVATSAINWDEPYLSAHLDGPCIADRAKGWNIGWFAVSVQKYGGLAIIVR